MKRSIALLFCAVFSWNVDAQEFEMSIFLDLPDSLELYHLEWADLGSDGVQDLVIFGQNANGEERLFFYQNDSLRHLQYSGSLLTDVNASASLLTDFDGDNSLDILITGTRGTDSVTLVFLNQGADGFFKVDSIFTSGGALRMADMDGDGVREILLSGESDGGPYLRVLKRDLDAWKIVHDSIRISATGLEAFDFDSDTDTDLFVSGVDPDGQRVVNTYSNHGEFAFTSSTVTLGITGVTIPADLNEDGRFDLLLAGKDSGGTDRLLMFMNTPTGFVAGDTLEGVSSPSLFAADLNSDGRCDQSLLGLGVDGDTINIVHTSGEVRKIEHHHVVTQAFGHGDRDGDLDLAQLVNNGSGYGLRILENLSPENLAPAAPTNLTVANIFGRMFLYWDKPADDHTPVSSLTYDVMVQSAGQPLVTGHFDLQSGRRLTVSGGNNGTANYALLRFGAGASSVMVQSVDNSFHAGSGSTCTGIPDSCVEIISEQVDACIGEFLVLASRDEALWFSFRDGFLGHRDTLGLFFQAPDTIFSFIPRFPCPLINTYTFRTGALASRQSDSTWVACEAQLLRLGVEAGWESVTWSSGRKGFLGTSDSLDYFVTGPDTLSVRLSDSTGCNVQRDVGLLISKPDVEVAPAAYQILKGQTVRLNAFGAGALSFEWAPPSSLDDPHGQTPLASPLQTTQYTVTAEDSLGCAASATVIVLVEETAFVPTLFTPNHDGSNDALRIYGLDDARDFSFTIYNRNGNVVYNTTRVSEAVSSGWGGSTGGQAQPSGIYYWKVEGLLGTGQRLLLNGKSTGSILLVR